MQAFPALVLGRDTELYVAAVLAAMAPDLAPFMADECLLSMPEVEGIDYTMKEYMKLVEKTNKCVERLNAQGESLTELPTFDNKFRQKQLFICWYVVQAGTGTRTRWSWRCGPTTS